MASVGNTDDFDLNKVLHNLGQMIGDLDAYAVEVIDSYYILPENNFFIHCYIPVPVPHANSPLQEGDRGYFCNSEPISKIFGIKLSPSNIIVYS